MKGVFQDGSEKTPAISFDAGTGVFELKGNSIPENSGSVYEPIVDFLKQYNEEALDSTTLNIALTYFNTSSSKWLLNILRLLKELITKHDKALEINWYYESEDEEMLEAAGDYESILDIPVNKIPQS